MAGIGFKKDRNWSRIHESCKWCDKSYRTIKYFLTCIS